jgi:hypothetical protein
MTYSSHEWAVEFEDEFEAEFDEFADPVRTELLARATVVAQFSGRRWGDPMSIL